MEITISKEAALDLIRPANYSSKSWSLKEEIGVEVMCKEYGEDDDWVGLMSEDYDTIRDGEEYKTFAIWI